jgi:hypothetical protein
MGQVRCVLFAGIKRCGVILDRQVPRKPRPLGRGPCLPAGRKGHNIKGKYLTGKPRPLGRGASLAKKSLAGGQFMESTEDVPQLNMILLIDSDHSQSVFVSPRLSDSSHDLGLSFEIG